MSPPPPPPPPPLLLLLLPHAATPNAASGVMQAIATTLRSVFISLPVARMWADSPQAVRQFVRSSCHLGGKIPDGKSSVFAHPLCAFSLAVCRGKESRSTSIFRHYEPSEVNCGRMTRRATSVHRRPANIGIS